MSQRKWFTQKEAWGIAEKLADIKYKSIEAVATEIGCHFSTIYRWQKAGSIPPNVRHNIALRELAIKEGIIKA